MITLTKPAAKQIRISAEQSGMDALALRLAVRQETDGNFHYGMGFDEVSDDDMSFTSEGIEVIFAPEFGPLLDGTVVDYVEMEPGEYRFIFMNPNDPNFKPPQEDQGKG